MSPSDPRLERLFGDGGRVLEGVRSRSGGGRVLWAIRERSGAIVDFVTGYSNPAS
jgi:hypothetical protein